MEYEKELFLDIIGDVHGCYEELLQLLQKLGYEKEQEGFRNKDGRKLVFVGDLCDRGPKSLEVILLVIRLVEMGVAFHCPGNHDDKLMRWCQGRRVQVKHGLETTVREIEQSNNPEEMRKQIVEYIQNLPLYFTFDKGKLVVAHAGIPTDKPNLPDKRLREICLYGFPTGKLDQHGLPERDPVVKHYHGKALLVHGHTPVHEPLQEKNIINIDTGCVFGGKLTCLRYPEKEFVSVKAREIYGESKRFRPLLEN
ncbi:MAG TPA: metallophosphoesterase [Bacillota bacterium]|nr:metallophosphoesterase [Bacillota bacterium]